MIRIAILTLITTLAAAITFFLNAIWLSDGRWAWTGLVTLVLFIIEIGVVSVLVEDWDRRR